MTIFIHMPWLSLVSVTNSVAIKMHEISPLVQVSLPYDMLEILKDFQQAELKRQDPEHVSFI